MVAIIAYDLNFAHTIVIFIQSYYKLPFFYHSLQILHIIYYLISYNFFFLGLWTIQKRLLDNSQDKEMSCFVCGKKYTYQRSLWRHLKYECNQAPMFRCKMCSYATKQKAHLKSHTFLVHYKNNLQSSSGSALQSSGD